VAEQNTSAFASHSPPDVGTSGSRIMTPEIITSEQSLDAAPGVSEVPPAHRLIAAVVQQALDDVKLGGTVGAEARKWLEARSKEQAWSFGWCCNELGLSSNAVRQRIQHVPGAFVIARGSMPAPSTGAVHTGD
jgi:hypothetical protein